MMPELTRDDVFIFETERLWLRWPRAADASALRAIAAHEQVATMTASWPHPLPDGEAERRIFAMRSCNAAGSGLVLAIAVKARPETLVGSIGGASAPDDGAFGFGYMLDPSLWGRGLMTEAVGAFADIVLGFSPTTSLRASTMRRNPASRRVLERNGFAQIGTAELHFPARGDSAITCDRFELRRAAWAVRSRLLPPNWRRSAA